MSSEDPSYKQVMAHAEMAEAGAGDKPAAAATAAEGGAPSGKEQGWLARAEAVFERIGKFVSPVVQIVLLASVALGFAEYFQHVEADRVGQSLSYVSLWEADKYRNDLATVNTALGPIYRENTADLAAADSEETLAAMLANLGDRLTGADSDFDSDLERSVDRVFYFFDRAGICSWNGLCNYDVLNSFLGDEARSFWRYFSSYARRKRDAGYEGFGRWAERFASGATPPKAWWWPL